MTLEDIFSYVVYILIMYGIIYVIVKILEFLYKLFFSGYEDRKQKEKIANMKEEAYQKEQKEVKSAIEWEIEKAGYEFTQAGYMPLPSQTVNRKWKKCEFCGEIVAYNLRFCPKCGAEVPKDYPEFTEQGR